MTYFPDSPNMNTINGHDSCRQSWTNIQMGTKLLAQTIATQ